ncbi:MAG: hypothetical protein ACKOLA_08635 [Spartobacteria bacterium]
MRTKVSKVLDFQMTSLRWVSGSAPASGAPPRALARRSEKSGQRPLEVLYVGRGAHPTAPEAGAVPETKRYRAYVKISISIQPLA